MYVLRLEVFKTARYFSSLKVAELQPTAANLDVLSVADPGFLKGGGAQSASQNLAPPTFYILMARAHAHHMNRTEHEHLS